MVLLQSTVEQVTGIIAQLGGLAILAATLAAVAAVVHRWYVRETVPRGLALLVGLSGVAVYMNTTTALAAVIDDATTTTETQKALFNIAAFLVGAGGANLGRWAGDRFGSDVLLGSGFAEIEEDIGRLVQSVGRVVTVELPGGIDDTVGYDPVPEETKETLAGKTFLFPRHLTVEELRDRLVTRLKTDYGVGHVDIELTDDGSIEYLALGSRAAGIGPTLPPATNAVAVRADPAFAASAGDLVQVWETDPMRRVLTAELRGVADDTVTIAIDAADTQKIDPTTEYRLVTLPVEDRPDREFASLLRAADETFSSVTVEAGSPLHGMPVGALSLSLVAIKPDGAEPTALPDPTTLLAPGDVVFAIARPDALRRLETAAQPLDPSLVSGPDDTATRQRPTPTADGPAERERDDTPASTEADAADSEPAGASGEPEALADDGTGQPDETVPETPSVDAPDEGTAATAEADAGPADADTEETEEADSTDGSSSFEQLKAEFDSGDADWAEDATANGDQSGGTEPEPDDAAPEPEAEAGPTDGESDEGLSALDDEEDIGIDESDSGLDGLDIDDGDDGLEGLSFDDEEEEDDDLSSLSFDDDDDDGLSLDDEDEEGEADDEEEEEDDDDDDDDDDGGSGGGAASFQQLKEEFDSGDADWEDDVSDSPGGDMRLDE